MMDCWKLTTRAGNGTVQVSGRLLSGPDISMHIRAFLEEFLLCLAILDRNYEASSMLRLLGHHRGMLCPSDVQQGLPVFKDSFASFIGTKVRQRPYLPPSFPPNYSS